jgi:hypothetical protein
MWNQKIGTCNEVRDSVNRSNNIDGVSLENILKGARSGEKLVRCMEGAPNMGQLQDIQTYSRYNSSLGLEPDWPKHRVRYVQNTYDEGVPVDSLF